MPKIGQQIGDASEPTVWEGRRLSLPGQASGGRLPAARYRVTTERVYWTAGRLARKTESVPLWAVREATVQQSVQQRARRLGTITVSLQHPDYQGLPTYVVLEDVERPRETAQKIRGAARQARKAHDARA
ncbi:MAG TPA: PH domain-containing protein [Nocardioidaceae bacterium]|nr:PH domain-containing protein [Nocardioidaceae bacterium]